MNAQWPPVTTEELGVEPSTDTVTYNIKQEIWVTFAKHGIHRYPDAPKEVDYLQVAHRHLFKFKVGITVHHDDREIEFHMFQNWLISLYDRGQLQLDNKSCEMIARNLIDCIHSRYDCHNRVVKVEVSEDGECGAILTAVPQIKLHPSFGV
jgi:hypothetical protein